jgi:hypothetical protein
MAGRDTRITERLPHFYLKWDRESVISSLVSTFGTRIDEAENDLVSVMRAHWVDTSHGLSLDLMGALLQMKRQENESDRDFRLRLKTAILSYKGGGTLAAIRRSISLALGMPKEIPVEIVENPPRRMERSWNVRANQEWTVNPRSIEDSTPEITITVATENASVKSPELVNLTTGDKIGFKGMLSPGDVLQIGPGGATLNGKDASRNLSGEVVPNLPRIRSKWKYNEELGGNVGVFDKTEFDKCVFAVDIISRISFSWTARQPATFEVQVPKKLLAEAGLSPQNLQDIINSIKAAGVQADLKVIGEVEG